MQATLQDVLKDDPGARLITLSCGHIFTVDTLDGHVDLTTCYTQRDGVWVGLRTPVGYQQRKACPACRGSITSPRYSRVTKRALLDLQEQVAAKHLKASLEVHQETIRALDAEKTALDVKNLLSNVVPAAPGHFDVKRMVNELATFKPTTVHCVDTNAFRCVKKNMFGVPGALGDAWRKAVSVHLSVHDALAKMVNSHRMPHNLAYESAVTSIYWQELDMTRLATGSTTHDLTQAALMEARRRVGAPPPGGQAACGADALCLVVEVRLDMYRVAVMFANNLWNGDGIIRDIDSERRKKQLNACRKAAASFQRLANGILLSCKRDVDLIVALAQKEELSLSALKAQFMAVNVSHELVHCKTMFSLRVAESAGVDRAAQRAKAAAELKAHSEAERERSSRTFDKVVSLLDVQQKDNAKYREEAVKVREAARKILATWAQFEARMGGDAWFEEVTYDEKASIMRAVLEKSFSERACSNLVDGRHWRADVSVSQRPPIQYRQRECYTKPMADHSVAWRCWKPSVPSAELLSGEEATSCGQTTGAMTSSRRLAAHRAPSRTPGWRTSPAAAEGGVSRAM